MATNQQAGGSRTCRKQGDEFDTCPLCGTDISQTELRRASDHFLREHLPEDCTGVSPLGAATVDDNPVRVGDVLDETTCGVCGGGVVFVGAEMDDGILSDRFRCADCDRTGSVSRHPDTRAERAREGALFGGPTGPESGSEQTTLSGWGGA